MTNIFTFGKTASHLYLTFCFLQYFFHNCIPPWVFHLFHLILQSVHGFPYLCTTSTPPYLCAPLYPHKNGFKSGGKFIRSKNKHVSASVLLPCRVPQGCTVLWMSPVFSPCLWSTRAHTHNTHQRTHILSKGHSEAVITSILQLCYRCYPLSSQSSLSPFLWVRSGENEAQNPAAIKCLLPLPNSSVWTHQSCTILHYLLYLLHTVPHQ